MILSIDRESCTRCGECHAECPSGAVRIDPESGCYRIDGDLCIRCSHCAAICPEAAVFSTGGKFAEWSDPKLDAAEVRSLLCGKRSVRRYRKDPLPRDLLEEILAVGSYTATASNRQDWSAVIIEGDAVRDAAAELTALYGFLLRLAGNPLVKLVLRFTPTADLIKRKGLLEHFAQRLKDFERGEDPFFFNAPVVVLLTYPRRNRHFGRINCVLAGQAMMYYAESLGIGSCMIGFMEVALRLRRSLRRQIGLSSSRRPGLIFTLGRTDVTYRRLPLRKRFPVRYLASSSFSS